MNRESSPEGDRVEAFREAMTMALYVSIVVLATLTALPTAPGSPEGGHGAGGVHGLGLIGVIWGTTLGLALAHWFAFRLTARAFGGGLVSGRDVRIGLAQMSGATVVALLCTIPVLLFDETHQVEGTAWVPATIVGIAGYAGARATGRTRIRSLVFALVAMVLGLAVAAVKNILLGH